MYKIIAVTGVDSKLDVSLNSDTKQSLSELILDKISDDSGIEMQQMHSILESILNNINIEKDISEPFKTSLLLIQGMRSVPLMETATSGWVDAYIQHRMRLDMSESLLRVDSDWGSKALLLVADKLGIEDPEVPFVRLTINFGKVIWWLNDGKKTWWKPGKVDRYGIQSLCVANQAEIGGVSDVVDLSLENFMKFKRAGKRRAAYKKIHLDDTVVLERNRINISNLVGLRKWDVSQYGVLPTSNSFDKDHIPQDKWLSEVGYELGPKIAVAEKLQLIIQPGNNATKIRKAIIELGNVSDLCKDEFPVLRDVSFINLSSAASENFKKKNTKKAYEEKLISFRPVLNRYRITFRSLSNKISELKQSIVDTKNNAYSIAVPKEIHKFSRTFALEGKITQERRMCTFSNEMFSDITHYTSSKNTKSYFQDNEGSLEGIGGLRHLYRQNAKAYGLNQDSHTKLLDVAFIEILKQWESCNLT